jgi:N-methylhydantoinase B/oxoprolinase/acetone carboxylase alpha subunit
LTNKSIFLTILDVKCEIGVNKRVRAALFEYLKRLGRDVLTRLLNVVSDNGSDATATIARLFQLVNTFIGYE